MCILDCKNCSDYIFKIYNQFLKIKHKIMLQDEQKLIYILFQGLFLFHYLDLRERKKL